MKGIRESYSEWIILIDDDIIIDDTSNSLYNYIDNKTGDIQGTAIHLREFENSSLNRPNEIYDVKLSNRMNRGYANITILRRELLLDSDISNLNAYEDSVISRHIIDKKFNWEMVPVFAGHWHDEKQGFYKSSWNANGLLQTSRNGHVPFFQVITRYALNILGRYHQLIAPLDKSSNVWNSMVLLLGSLSVPIFPFFRMRG
jgi:hypothetical protein